MNVGYIKEKTRLLREQTLIVYYAARDPRMPISARVLALLVAAYALSPVDLIPDFIPIVGLIDDILIIPAGLWLVLQLTQAEVIAVAEIKARESINKPVSYTAAIFIILLWAVLIWIVLSWILNKS